MRFLNSYALLRYQSLGTIHTLFTVCFTSLTNRFNAVFACLFQSHQTIITMVLRSRAVQACIAAATVFTPAVDAFPTAENFAKLVGRYTPGLDDASAHFAKIQEELVKLREKRLLFDPLTEPIDSTYKTMSRSQSH